MASPGAQQYVQDWHRDVEHIARSLNGLGGAEFDDLVQEGLKFVWESFEKGVEPSPHLIRKRMINWTRTVRRQNARR